MKQHPMREWKARLTLAAVVISIATVVAGILYYRAEKRETQEQRYQELHAIATLKVNQLTQWHRERFSEARFFTGSEPFNAFANELLAGDTTNHDEFRESLKRIMTDGRYENIVLLNNMGEVVFSVDTEVKSEDPKTIQLASQAIVSGEITIQDIYFCEVHQKVHFKILAPVRNPLGQTIGCQVFVVAPGDYLYPLLKDWPTPARTSETLIVRLEGDSVRYLNEMRNHDNSRLQLIVELADSSRLAVKAAMGLTGLQVGTDYSGNKVYGDITQVPGTAWYMISKIQKQELFQDLRTKSILILIVIVLGLLSIFSSISWIYQIRQKAIAGELRIRNEELQKSREDIVKLNQDLERQVRERTMELETKVEMLRQGEKEMLLVVDDLNKMTSELSQERNKLEVTNRELEAFSYSVSHDLRAPLRGIDGFTGILLSEYGDQLDEEGKRLCAIIKNNARSMGQLIDDLLAFSRLARHENNHEKIDMERMFYSVFTGITGNLEKESIDFHMDSLEDCVGDKALIRQVVVNLLSNAIKFTSKTDKPRIEVSCQRKDQHIVYFVRDNGAGFDMKYSDKLFGVFQRLHTIAEFDGTGVGLANVKRIVTRHGGEVGASGEVNKEANFWFSLPFQA